ncbi:MAG: DEAD/DEAH box helicase [Cellulomonadaceae bacterium]|jgi:SNF2 family DNA or RNA helicase|nr:DEAD/DEAH box helicase [Cellulomonadaceae bacterium]
MANISLSRLNQICGSAAVTRGRVYYEASRVIQIDHDKDSQIITGVVKGRQTPSYKVVIFLSNTEFTGGECTCPVGGNCKHVVAVALAAAGTAKEFAIKGQVAGWQRSLDTLMRKAQISSGSSPDLPPDDPYEVIPLGLQFRVDGLIKDATRRKALLARGVSSVTGISVRPVQKNLGTGNWTGGYQVTWDQLRRHKTAEAAARFQLGFDTRPATKWDPLITEWFGELAAMRSQGYWGATEWISLSDFPDRLVWDQLKLGHQLGVPYVGNGKLEQIILAESASVSLDITRAGDKVHLASSILINDKAITNNIRGPIGNRGIYAVTEPTDNRGGWIITLAPTTEQLTAASLALLDLGSELVIPEDDLEAFTRDYLPTLNRHLSLASSDSSIELPQALAPTLVVTATFPKPTAAQLSAHWEYESEDSGSLSFPVADSRGHPSRDRKAEQEIWQRLSAALREAGLDMLAVQGDLGFADFEALRLVSEIMPVIAKVPDVRTELVGNPAFTELTEQPIIELDSKESSDADWFDLAVTVRVAEREIPLPNLLEAIAKGRQKLMLVDGSWLRLNHPSLEQLRALLAEADRLTDRKGKLQISRLQAGLWDELSQLADVVQQSESWRQSVTALLALQKAASSSEISLIDHIELHPDISAELRPYQHHGFNWLAFCYKYGLGGILADDMGLGKTLQAISLITHAKELAASATAGSDGAMQALPKAPPFLVVAPASVVGNWVNEVKKFNPNLQVAVLNRTARTEREAAEVFARIANMDIVVTSYAIFRLDAARFAALEWSGLILDEAQFIKNHTTKANQAARKLRAPFKLAMTGTPLENNVTELWSLLAVVAPGLFPSYERFREDYVRPIEAIHKFDADEALREHGRKQIELLRRRVSPLMLRRTKEQVAPELPPRIEQIIEVDLDPAHRRAYDIHLTRERQRVLGLLTDFEANKVAVFRALTTMRRMALDASLIDPEEYADIPSSKLDVLFEHLESVIAEGHRVLIFSQFTSYLQIVAKRAQEHGIEFAYLTGATRNRPQVIESFQNGSKPLFLISLKAGGFGLNLTEADYVFILDPWWNPAVEAQAVDRTHRIGQQKTVNVFRLVASGTIEDKVMALKSRKAALVSAILQGDPESADLGAADDMAHGAKLTAADIRSLLS